MTRGYERFSVRPRAEVRERVRPDRGPADRDDDWAWAPRGETAAEPESPGRHAAPAAAGSAELAAYQGPHFTTNAPAQMIEHAQELAEELRRALALAQALMSSNDRADDPSPPWSYAGGPTLMSRGRRHFALEDDDWPTTTTSAARSWMLDGPVSIVEPRRAVARGWVSRALPPLARRRIPLLPAARLTLLFVAGAIPVLSISLQVFGVLPLAISARYVVLPLTLASAMVMVGPSVQGAWATQGLLAGLLAVAAYDTLRIPWAVAGVIPDFIPRVGGWVLSSESPNLVVGYLWRYLVNGGGMGVSYFVTCGVVLSVWPAAIYRAPVALSIGYGVFIWSGLVATIALSSGAHLLFRLTPLSLAVSLAGHLVYGGVLGLWLRHMLSGPVVGAWPVPSGSARSSVDIRP